MLYLKYHTGLVKPVTCSHRWSEIERIRKNVGEVAALEFAAIGLARKWPERAARPG